MTDKQIQIFLAVHRYSSCSHASDALFISQSSVSKYIKSLEEELSCSLFNRINGKMLLTDAGKLFLDYATELQGKRDKLIADINYLTNGSQRIPFTIGGLPCTYEYRAMDIITGFQLSHPQYIVEYNEANQSELFGKLDSKALDIVFARLDFLSPAQYNTRILADDELVLLCRVGKLSLPEDSFVDLSALEMDYLITFTHASSIRGLVEKQFETCRAAMPQKILECSRHRQILSLLATGGYTILPKVLVDTSPVQAINTYHIAKGIKTCVGFAWRRESTSKVKPFLSYLAEQQIIPQWNRDSSSE